MSNSLFNKMFIHFLLSQFILFKRNNTVLKNLFINDIILLRLMSVTNNVKMKLIMIILND